MQNDLSIYIKKNTIDFLNPPKCNGIARNIQIIKKCCQRIIFLTRQVCFLKSSQYYT